ncbi:MAG: DNA gyrase inhibitor YacG [Proteobacteria bacterium]|nr:DNA gyrase inhibitor YacG [Pseudomonadota bacterium]MBI3498824.1 DNA gyrase inhibitor YacG [Pseudomonadota bacterium]
MLCPICERPAIEPRYRPFCSRRCADIDLGRWFNESYRVPAKQPSEDEDEDPAAPAGEAKNRED